MTRILLLGGTTEASLMARALAEVRLDAVFSYAGRTHSPKTQPLPVRIGGFGGSAGLAAYLRAEGISHVIDATHPFALGMSRNAAAACAETKLPLIALERPPWTAAAGDKWRNVPDVDAAVAALPATPARVFLAIGRQNLAAFARAPQHRYVVRLVDAPRIALPLPQCDTIVARGPFTIEGDLELLETHRIGLVVAKNAGGEGARAKLDAARRLGLPVVMIDRPPMPQRSSAQTVAEVMHWLRHAYPARLGV